MIKKSFSILTGEAGFAFMQLGSCGSGIKTRAPVSRKKRSTRSSGIKQADWFPKKAKHSRFGNQMGRLVPEKSEALAVRESNRQTGSRKKRGTHGSGIKQADRFPQKS